MCYGGTVQPNADGRGRDGGLEHANDTVKARQIGEDIVIVLGVGWSFMIYRCEVGLNVLLARILPHDIAEGFVSTSALTALLLTRGIEVDLKSEKS